ncbi:Digeranylgeranylglycerophospholipid reductase [uncultured archaeon]|nr:Digeranylgeranylglycerophospholipid reductase [uncultured archaeon]
MHMAAVAGAGPAGLAAAKRIQEKGWQTVVLEEHPKVGEPAACTGLISASGVNDLKLRKAVDASLMNGIKGCQIYSPSHEMIEVKRNETVAYVVDRGQFDRALCQESIEAGVEIRPSTRLIDIRNESLFVEHRGRGELVKARVVVGADGVNSRVRKIIGIDANAKDFVHAYQVDVSGRFDPRYVQLYFGDYAKGFFAWIVPESEERARIGLASISGNVKKDFGLFTSEKNITGEFSDMCSSLIPIGEPLKGISKDNILLAGDAAFHTKATTGGGIIMGIEAGRIAGDTIDAHFKDNAPLSAYEKNLESLNKELKMHWKMRQFINSLSSEQVDSMLRKMRRAKVGEFLSEAGDMDRPSRFLGRMLAKPSFWGLFPEAVKFLTT